MKVTEKKETIVVDSLAGGLEGVHGALERTGDEGKLWKLNQAADARFYFPLGYQYRKAAIRTSSRDSGLDQNEKQGGR